MNIWRTQERAPPFREMPNGQIAMNLDGVSLQMARKRKLKVQDKGYGYWRKRSGGEEARNTYCSESPLWLLLTEVWCPVDGWSYSECLGTLLSPAKDVLKRCDLIPSLRVPSPLLMMEAWSWTEGWSCTERTGTLLISVGGLKASEGKSYLF